MPFGKRTREKQIPLDDITPQQSLALLVASARMLNWEMIHINDNGFAAISIHNQIDVVINDHSFTIKSTDIKPQLITLGENEQNIDLLVDQDRQNKTAYPTEQLDEQYTQLK